MPSDPTRALLEAAATELDQGHHAEFAEHLRSAWRLSKDPLLAELYELLVREHSAPMLVGRTSNQRARAWLERATRSAGAPLELPPLLLAEPPLDWLDTASRLRLLAAWSPDPLLASELARRLRFAALGWTVPEAWPHHLDLLDAQLDPRQLPTLERLLERPSMRADLRARVRRVRDSLAQTRTSPVPKPAIAPLERRASRRRAFEQRSAELLAAVHSSPDRDEPRLVYADWLTDHGDPRGEFISLQIERARSGDPPTARERELLDCHGERWAGLLHGLLGARKFERGFVGTGSIEVPDLDGELVELADWSTLRVLDGRMSVALAFGGRFEHLRELYGFLQLDRFLAARARDRLGAVERYECSLGDPNLPLDTPLGLRSLLIRGGLDDTILALTRSPAIHGLAQLDVYYQSSEAYVVDHRERRSIRHRAQLLGPALPTHVRRFGLLDDGTVRASRPSGWMFRFERDELDLFSRVRVDWQRPALDRQREDPLAQLLRLLSELGLDSLRRLTLGRCDDLPRELALDRIAELTTGLDIELTSA